MKVITIVDWIWKETVVTYGRHYSDRCLARFRKTDSQVKQQVIQSRIDL
jgi:hypothetical protein